jgi:hypothetical protein
MPEDVLAAAARAAKAHDRPAGARGASLQAPPTRQQASAPLPAELEGAAPDEEAVAGYPVLASRAERLAGGMAAAWPYCDAVVSAHTVHALDELTAALAHPVQRRPSARDASRR